MNRRLVLLVAVLLLLPVAAHAQATAAVIDTVTMRFKTTLAGWEGGLQAIALRTFGTLAVIQLFWAMAKLVFRRADFSEFMAELVNQIMFLGLFFWLLTTPTTWGPAILNGFMRAGASVGAAPMTPGTVFASGIDLAVKAMGKVSILTPSTSLGLIICALVILICFSWITATMVMALVQSYFILSGGVLFLMFGASQWTKDIAIGLVRAVLGIGAKLFALQLITSIGVTFVQAWVAQFNGIDEVSQNLMIEIGQSIVLLAITQTIPNELERMIGGASLAGAGALAGAAAELTGAAAAIGVATAKLATTIAGAGALTGAAGALANAQMNARVAAGTAPQTAAGRGAAMLSSTALNMGSAVGTDIGRRLSGQATRFGVAPFRQAADLTERSRLLNEQSDAPLPP